MEESQQGSNDKIQASASDAAASSGHSVAAPELGPRAIIGVCVCVYACPPYLIEFFRGRPQGGDNFNFTFQSACAHLCCKNMCCVSRFCTGGRGAAGTTAKQMSKGP